MHEDDDDAALFRAAVGKVDPLRTDATPPPERPRPRPAVRRDGDRGDAHGMAGLLAESPDAVLLRGDASAFRRERVNARDWQRLRRGQFSAQDELDLHGACALEAAALVAHYLDEEQHAV